MFVLACLFVCFSLFVCLFSLLVWLFVCLFVCLFVLQAIYVTRCREKEVHDCCLKSYWVFYFSNVWRDYIPDANCSGVDAAPGGYVMAAVICWF